VFDFGNAYNTTDHLSKNDGEKFSVTVKGLLYTGTVAFSSRGFQYRGTWQNTSTFLGHVNSLVISVSGTTVTVHGYVTCKLIGACDLGSASVVFRGEPLVVTIESGTLTLRLLNDQGTSLSVVDSAYASATDQFGKA
jgi:hypothetical protein